MAVEIKDPMSDPNQLINYFSPDINRGFDDSVVHNFGQLFKNVGSIIATEARRALAFIKHPVNTGFLTNRKILAMLEEINEKHHPIIAKVVGKYEEQLNTENSKYLRGHRKHDIMRIIHQLKENVGVKSKKHPVSTRPLGERGFTPVQEPREQAEPLWKRFLNGRDATLDSDQPEVAESLVEEKQESPPQSNLEQKRRSVHLWTPFLYPDTNIPQDTLPELAQSAPSEPVAEGIRTVGWQNYAKERVEFRRVVSYLQRLVRSEEFQQIFANLKPGHYEVSFDEVGFQKLLEGIPQKDRDVWAARLKDLTFIIDKNNRGVFASIAEQAGRKRLGAPVAFDPEAQNPVNEALEEMLMQVIYEPPATPQVRAPRVQAAQGRESAEIELADFSRKAFKQLLQNIDALAREDNIPKVLSALKPGRYKVTLDDNRIQKLVEGLSRNEKALLVPQLKVWDFFVEKNERGAFLSVGEKGGGKRLGAPTTLDPETQQLLANALSEALRSVLSDADRSIGNFNAALDQTESLLKRNDGRRERLLEALNRGNVTPQKVKEIRRELIELRKQLEASLVALETAYKAAKANLSENDKGVRNTYAWTLAALSRQLYHDLHPEPLIGPNQPLNELHWARRARASQPRPLPSIARGSDDRRDQYVKSNEELKGLRGAREARISLDQLLKETATALEGFKERKDQLLSEAKTIHTEGALLDLKGEVLKSRMELLRSDFNQHQGGSLEHGNTRVLDVQRELENLCAEIDEALEPGPNVESLEETKMETLPVEPRAVREKSKQVSGQRPGVRPLLMLTMMLTAMFFAGKSVLEGQQVSDGVSIRSQDGFAPVPVEDFKFEPQPFTWSDEPVRGEMGMLYDALEKGTPQKSVDAAITLARMYEPGDQDRIYFLSQIFESFRNDDYFNSQVDYWLDIGKKGDRSVKQELEPYFEIVKEIVTADGASDSVRILAKFVMNKIGQAGFFQKEIFDLPMPETINLLYHVISKPFDPTQFVPDIEAAYDLVKREIPKGQNSHLAGHLRKLEIIIQEDSASETRLRRGTDEDVKKVATWLTYNSDLYRTYPHIFGNPAVVQKLMKMIENDAIRIKSPSSYINPVDEPIYGIFNIVSYGVLAHPEDKEPQRLLFEFWKRGVMQDTIVAMPTPAVYPYLKNGLETRLPAAVEIAKRELANGEYSYLAWEQRNELAEYIRMHPDIS